MTKRGDTATSETPPWIWLQGRTNARLLLLARETDADFVAPADRDTFATVRGRSAGCVWELRVVHDASDTARTGAARHSLELEMQHYANRTTRRFAGTGLVPPGLDPARVRTEIEANCVSFVRHG